MRYKKWSQGSVFICFIIQQTFIMKLLISIMIFSLVVQDVHLTKSSKPAMTDISKALQRFTAYLTYTNNAINQDNMENMLYSPISIAETLGMVMTGARESTNDIIKRILILHSEREYGQSNIDNLFRKIRNKTFKNKGRPDASDNAIVTMANKAYVQDSFKILPEYAATLRNSYGAEAEQIDFNDPNAAVGRINTWINNQTGGMVQDLIQSADLSPHTRLLFVNALYFNANWKNEMNKEGTKLFHNHAEEEREMHFIGGKLSAGVIRGRHYSTVFLTYNSSVNTYMVINKLPTKEAWDEFFRYGNLETYFTETIINKPRRKHRVHISMPEFDLEVSTYLTKLLTRMGMDEIFEMNYWDRHANFSGIATREYLYPSKIKHKAKISVNEGTKGAPATATIYLARSVQRYHRVVIDKPFVFSIVRNKHVLFFGAVKDFR